MHISSANIIRFPEAPVSPVRNVERDPAQQPAEIVVFSPVQPDDERFGSAAQQHGQVHAAHRIVSRIADQLDSFAPL